MAVVDVELDWKSVKRKVTKDGRKGSSRYTVKFDGSDTMFEMAILAAKASGIPSVGTSFPGDTWLLCDSIDPKPLSPKLFEVECSYIMGGWSVPEQEDNPLKQKPKIRYYSVVTTEQIDRDITGKPILNSAEEPFDPPITAEVYTSAMEIVRNERSFSQATVGNYGNTLNRFTYRGSLPGTLWMSRLDAEEVIAGDYEYARVTYEIQYRPDGWRRRILDQGLRVLSTMATTTSSGGQTARISQSANILDENGLPLSEPHLLNGYGGILPKGYIFPNGDRAVWLYFEDKDKANWRALNLP